LREFTISAEVATILPFRITSVTSAIFEEAAFEKCDGLFAGCCDSRFEAAFGKRVFNNYLNIGIVLDDQNQRQLLHRYTH